MQVTTLSKPLGFASQIAVWYRDATSVLCGFLLIDLCHGQIIYCVIVQTPNPIRKNFISQTIATFKLCGRKTNDKSLLSKHLSRFHAGGKINDLCLVQKNLSGFSANA